MIKMNLKNIGRFVVLFFAAVIAFLLHKKQPKNNIEMAEKEAQNKAEKEREQIEKTDATVLVDNSSNADELRRKQTELVAGFRNNTRNRIREAVQRNATN